MGRGFGGGSFGGGSSSGGSGGWGSGYSSYNHHNSSGTFGLLEIFLFGGLGLIILIVVVWNSFIVTLSTKWRTPLEHSNDTMNISEIQLNNEEDTQASLEYLYEKTGIVGRIITIRGTFYSSNDPDENYTNIQKNLYYDERNTFYLYNSSSFEDYRSNFAANYAVPQILKDLGIPSSDSHTTPAPYSSYNRAENLSESELEQMCKSIYDYLYDDEYHMLIINLSDFSEWGFAYYTWDEADRVFDKQAGNIFASLAKKESSFKDIPEVLEKTTDVIMDPPIKFYVFILLVAAIVGVTIYIIAKNSKKIKSSLKQKKSEVASGAKNALEKIDDFTVREFKD